MNGKQRTKNKVGKIQEETSKASLPVNYFRNQPKKSFTFHEVILGGAIKISTIFSQINATYHPMKPDTDVYMSDCQFV